MVCDPHIRCMPPTVSAKVQLAASAVSWQQRCTARICCCEPGRAAIDRYLLPAGPTAANPPQRLNDGTHRRTTDPPDSFIDPTIRIIRICELCQQQWRIKGGIDRWLSPFAGIPNLKHLDKIFLLHTPREVPTLGDFISLFRRSPRPSTESRQNLPFGWIRYAGA